MKNGITIRETLPHVVPQFRGVRRGRACACPCLPWGLRKRSPYTTGSALIVVLWVVCLLSIMIASFAFDAHVQARITSYTRNRAKAEAIARSGLEVANLLMIKSGELSKNKGAAAETSALEEEDRWHDAARQLADGFSIEGLREPLGDGVIELSIAYEPAARRNVNQLDYESWERVLEVGDIPEELWEDLIECATNGVFKDEIEVPESRKGQKPTYRTVDELLLVKGFSPVILYGGMLKLSDDEDDEPIPVSGIWDLLTTYGVNTVNVNVALPRVLMTLPEVDSLVAEAIVEEREGTAGETGESQNAPFQNPKDFCYRMGLSGEVEKYVTTSSDGIYRITSVGIVRNVRKEIWCIVEYANKSMKIRSWREQD